MLKTIALDAMGGDHGPKVVVPAAVEILKKHSNIKFILVGLQDVVKQHVDEHAAAFKDRIEIHHASEVVEMGESPSQALRNKKDSSMRVAINLVKEGRALACVSAGNTGALMATSRFVLKTLPGIDRPAITTGFPSLTGHPVRMIDLGANVDSSSENLYQFAVMASILMSAVHNIEAPKVGLLNIGEEDIKGNDLVKKTAELLTNSSAINYVGYIEANRIFEGIVDVIVCDGFVGNVTIKTVEGVAKIVGKLAKDAFKSWWAKLLIMPSLPILKKLMKRVNPERQNGATFLGLNGIVVKSHGGAGVLAFTHAIEEAVLETEMNIPKLIKERVAKILEVEGV